MKLEITQKLRNIDSELILDLLKNNKEDYLIITDEYADEHFDVIDIILENKKIDLTDSKYVTHVVQGLSYFKNNKLLENILVKLSKNLKEKYLDRDSIGKFFDKFSCKFDEKYYWERLCLNPNLPEWFFEKYIDKVSWYWLCRNTSISEEFFEKHLDKVVWSELCQNPNMSEKFFKKHLDKVTLELSRNNNISQDFFEKYMIFRGINFNLLCLHPNISESFFEKYIIHVHWENLCQNPNISEAFFERHIKNIKKEYWEHICKNTNLSEEFFERHIKYVNWSSLCENSNISEEFFEKYIDKVDFISIFKNSNISECFIRKHIDKIIEKDLFIYLCPNYHNKLSEHFFEKYSKHIDWTWIKQNKKLSEVFYNKHIKNIQWDLEYGPIFSEKFIEKHISNGCNIYLGNISEESKISTSFFEKHLDKIQWYGICENSKISLSFFEKYFDKLEDLEELCNNNFRNSKKGFSKWLKNNPQYPFDNLLQNYVTFFPKLTY